MQIKVMHREQCFAAAGGYGQEYNTESITIPTMTISISCLGKAIPNRLEKYRRENKNIINVAYPENTIAVFAYGVPGTRLRHGLWVPTMS